MRSAASSSHPYVEDRLASGVRPLPREEIDRASDETGLLTLACQLALGDGAHLAAWIGEARNDDARSVRLRMQVGEPLPELARGLVVWSAEERGNDPTGAAIRTRVPCVMKNLRGDRRAPLGGLIRRLNIATALAVPIVIGGELYGALTIYSRREGAFPGEEISALVELTRCVASSVARLRSQAAAARRAAALFESERRFQMIFESSSALMALISPDGIIRDINETAHKVLRCDVSEVVGRPLWELPPNPEQVPLVRAMIEQVVRDRVRVVRELTGMVRFEPSRTFEVGIAPIVDATGELSALLVEATDVTGRRQRPVSATDENLRELADNLEEVLWIIDVHTARVAYVSPAFEDVWGRSPPSYDEPIGAWLTGVHPDDAAGFERAVGQFQKGSPASFHFRLIRPDGSVRRLRSRGFPVFDNEGKVTRIVGTSRDVTRDSTEYNAP
jgi:PAS domain S-box-containing protein